MVIKVSLNGVTEDIETVSDAMDFLQRWPVDRRWPAYRTALKACGAASAAQMADQDALTAFAAFACLMETLVASDAPVLPMEA
ncbi:DUF982 domain-containing protein [Mesorhizobium sp. PAMC28654]|uniref:DUF982 domain-containing protein n=1 Tax=Mesorhizobium sp. PAMC28654 TaxID=2880934 RepID=UPI001D0A6E84|nr:DUF982 domain-containing protein [Mesorhizobium sp. PAMC28654]UDL90487.1 DUF982 domain-containing protein [Mesorhizobium sp. PAMC28654]